MNLNLNLIRNWVHFPNKLRTKSLCTVSTPCNNASFPERIRVLQSRTRKMERDRERQLPKQRHNENALRTQPDSKQRTRLRGHPKDEEDVRISKTLSWLLRHGAKKEGLTMRPDGYVRVHDLVGAFSFSR